MWPLQILIMLLAAAATKPNSSFAVVNVASSGILNAAMVLRSKSQNGAGNGGKTSTDVMPATTI